MTSGSGPGTVTVSTNPAPNPLLIEALRLAELGYPVFPLLEGTKTPATPHGLNDASCNEATLELWWRATPAANIGLRCDRVLALDLDPGSPWLEDDDRMRDLLRGPCAITPRGGRHFLFRIPAGKCWKNTAGQIEDNTDTRTTGGYIVVAPSVVNGVAYRWVPGSELDCEPSHLPEPPAWLIDLLDERASNDATTSERGDVATTGSEIPSGQRNHALASLAGVMRRHGMGEAEIRASLTVTNETRCNPPLLQSEVNKVAWSVTRYTPDQIAQAGVENWWDQIGGDDADDEAEIVAPDKYKLPDSLPSEVFEDMPHAMRLAFDWMLDNSIVPQPALSLGACVALFGGLLGRKVQDDYNTFTNIYAIGLAPSGAGKDSPRARAKEILYASQQPQLIGPDNLGSGQGLLEHLCNKPVIVSFLDEISHMLGDMKNADAHSSHLTSIAKFLLQLYSSANSSVSNGAVVDMTRFRIIHKPSFSLFGTATPGKFYEALTPGNLTDGLAGRLMLFEAKERGTRQKPAGSPIPGKLLDWTKVWAAPTPGCGDLDAVSPTVTAIEKTSEADDLHEAYCNAVFEKHESDSDVEAAIWARAPEKAAKLALIHACGSCTDRLPRITGDAERWGIALADYTTKALLIGSGNYVAENRFERNKKEAWRHITDGMTARDLARKMQSLRKVELTEIVDSFVMTGAIRMDERKTGGRTRKEFRKLRSVL